MSKSVVIKLGSGNLYNGFPGITVQLWAAGHPLPEQFIGSLPPAPTLVELYRNWQSNYQRLCDRQLLRSPAVEEDDQLEIDSEGITNVSVSDYDQLCQKLLESMNAWLKSEGVLNISRQLRSGLEPRAEIRVIIETKDDIMRRLPWHRCDFFGDYPLAEMALSKPDYKRARLQQSKDTRNLRILAVLGNTFGIDIEAETKFLKSLPDAEVVFLVKPNRQEFNTHLWDNLGWDILFFAGHSQSEGENGRIYINENQTNNSLRIEQLEEALLVAIDKGLKLAIFNSCDGLGLASGLEKLNIPTVIVMREPVPNLVAQEFFKHFLQAFAVERLPLYHSVQLSRWKLQGLEDKFPAASWLPVICQNPAVEPPTWLNLGGIPPCPYRGLFAFREEDAHLFKAREQFTSDLVAAVKRKPLVAVVGPSGSGKSSVVFAGLIPQLRQDSNVEWQIISFRPGKNPIAALAAAFAPLLHNHDNNQRLVELELEIAIRQNLSKVIEKIVQGDRLLLIADQFEELYTLVPEEERQPFLDILLGAVGFAPAFTLVITLRADFYGYALSYRPFSDVLQGAVLNLGPMSTSELRLAIEKPAALMQVGLEKELTNQLIRAVKGQSGRLPLLEFALTSLWAKQKDGLLTHQAYEEIGGVEEAVGTHAEAVYAQLTEADRQRAQRVFIQLVRLGEGAEATRRLATRDQVKENWDLVTRLASTRLVVTNCNESNEETVEIVHEALIGSWGRLEYWMQVDGEFRRWQEQLRVAIRTWESSGFDEGALLRGKPLADAEYWQNNRQQELSSGERSFIFASQALRDREFNKHKRRRQLTISGLTTGLVLALSLAGVAWWQWQNSAQSEIKAISESSAALLASHKTLDALREAIKAGQKLQNLGVASPQTQMQVKLLLRQIVYQVKERNRLLGDRSFVHSVSFSADGKTFASAHEDKNIKLWSLDGQELKTLRGHKGSVTCVSFSPNGKILASASEDKTIKLWSRDGQLLHTLIGHGGAVMSVSFSSDGKTLASASEDKTIKLWSLDGRLLQTLIGHGDAVTSVSFNPSGKTLASASKDQTIKLWSLDGRLLQTLIGHGDAVTSVSFNPNGKTFVSASQDSTVKLWSWDGRVIKTLSMHKGPVTCVSFSLDGKTFASASWDGTIKLWSWDGLFLQDYYAHDDTVYSVSFSPDGNTFVSGSRDSTIKLWNRHGQEPQTLTGHGSAVTSASFSPDGRILASASGDKTIKLWSLHGQLLHTLTGHGGVVTSVSFSPDGETLASTSVDKTIKLWSLHGQLLHTLTGHDGVVTSVSFSPDGKTLASASGDKTIKLWSLHGQLLHTLTGHDGVVTSVSFSPDGKTLASASGDKTIKLWSLYGQLLHTLTRHGGAVTSVSFSPDGETLASGSQDNTIKLWNKDGQELSTITGHKAAVESISFSPDSKTLVSATQDKKIILWNLNINDLLARGCNSLRDYLKTNPNNNEDIRHFCNNIETSRS